MRGAHEKRGTKGQERKKKGNERDEKKKRAKTCVIRQDFTAIQYTKQAKCVYSL